MEKFQEKGPSAGTTKLKSYKSTREVVRCQSLISLDYFGIAKTFRNISCALLTAICMI